MSILRSQVVGVGSYLPEQVLTNEDLAKKVDTSDEWIVKRTGIKQRHIAAEGELTSDLGREAALRAMSAAQVKAEEVDLIVLATTTPDNTFPATAARIQSQLGVTKGPAFDVQAVCSGFVFGLAMADNMLRLGQATTALVIGAEIYSRILDWNDRGTCVSVRRRRRRGRAEGGRAARARTGPRHSINPYLYRRHALRSALCRWRSRRRTVRRAMSGCKGRKFFGLLSTAWQVLFAPDLKRMA